MATNSVVSFDSASSGLSTNGEVDHQMVGRHCFNLNLSLGYMAMGSPFNLDRNQTLGVAGSTRITKDTLQLAPSTEIQQE